MSEIPRGAIAPSVRALLAAFHEETHFKLDLAPVHSMPIYERAVDGWLCRVGEDGWLLDADLDKSAAVTGEDSRSPMRPDLSGEPQLGTDGLV
ncbi:hypothetical protein [Nocardia sp. NPDC049526]|uniref:hypothetical protein n=1 Tax=Nocardia sp. NPDC049526 TaxID=3364316 RepID=UPI0037A70574